jgi:hypothetical protein
MPHPEIWLTAIAVTGFVFLIIFAGIIPARISAKATKNKYYKYDDAYYNAFVGIICFWIACSAVLLIIAYIFRNAFVGYVGFITLLIMCGGIFLFADPVNGAKKAYGKTLVVAILCFVVSAISIFPTSTEDEKKAANATFDQTVTYHLDANGHKLEGETVTYPINSLRSNTNGDTYTWVERKEDGTLATRSVQKVNDDRYEVTLKDDLPATDTEARVERIVEYQVKSDAIAVGKEACVHRYTPDSFGLYPRCGDRSETVKFVKARTIIHIPAGTVDKMVPVVGE